MLYGIFATLLADGSHVVPATWALGSGPKTAIYTLLGTGPTEKNWTYTQVHKHRTESTSHQIEEASLLSECIFGFCQNAVPVTFAFDMGISIAGFL